MYKITNIESLGQNYTVADPEGNVIKIMQIISHTDILEAAMGPYTEDFDSVSSYLEKSVKRMTGFEAVDATKVLWYSTEDDEVVLAEVIEYAIKNGYDKIILEHLDEQE